jgi:hypothetical protein
LIKYAKTIHEIGLEGEQTFELDAVLFFVKENNKK